MSSDFISYSTLESEHNWEGPVYSVKKPTNVQLHYWINGGPILNPMNADALS